MTDLQAELQAAIGGMVADLTVAARIDRLIAETQGRR
jgi:hypothetical protein